MFFYNIKNLDPIYNSEWGQGTIVNVTWRKSDQLLMCWFRKTREHIWITSDDVSSSSSFSLEPFTIKKEDLKENVKKSKMRTFSFEDL